MTSKRKIFPLEDLRQQLDQHTSQGQVVVHCHGVFDLLHPGHFRHLADAKNRGDVLVVTITADEFVGKGPGRPAFSGSLRCEALAGLESVDYVAIVEEGSALPAIGVVRPQYYVKGSEYLDARDDPTGMIQQERVLVEAFGGQVVFTEDVTFSSSNLLNAFMPRHSEETRSWLNDIRNEFGIDGVCEWLDRIRELKVVVVGEAILDVYTHCETLGVASKEPVLCLNRESSVTYAGGTLAIAKHCAGLGATVSLVTGINTRDQTSPHLDTLRGLNIELDLVNIDPRPTIRKERVLDKRTQARVVELYDMDDSPLDGKALEELQSTLSHRLGPDDVILVADYGHGFLSDSVVEALCQTTNYLCLNAQTNAGNHGFNSVQRYGRADFVTLNGSEARLEVRRRHVDLPSYIPDLGSTMGAQAVLVTQGGSGLDMYLAGGEAVRAPALAPFVTDRVGAGDAVLAVTSLLMRLGAPPAVVGLLGNVVGAWAVSFLGNERSLELGSLKKQVVAVLK